MPFPPLKILPKTTVEQDTVLTAEALTFVAELVHEFGPAVGKLLARRVEFQAEVDSGKNPIFLEETAKVRKGKWKVAQLPADLKRRHVEITGPVDRKMIINALNSGADVFMADLEDSNSPTFDNCVNGQVNLRDAVLGTISFHDEEKKKDYELEEKVATLMVRPRGLHLTEKHATVSKSAIPASLFDFGLYFFHNAKELVSRGSGPYFYLPKLQSHLEARWWNDVFVFAQKRLGVPKGTIKATVLIETLPAAFEMDEILYELRDHSAGLNCGRWDYIFSFIKTFRNRKGFVLPDRSQIGMTQPFMKAYTDLLIKTCHRRGAFAMGGMAAQIPIKGTSATARAANEKALAKVRVDKQREADSGHDGSWVAHPGLVPIAAEIFGAAMKGDNQIDRQRDDVTVTAADLIAVPRGPVTDSGLRHNIRVGIQYLEAWLRGVGCVPLYNLMEDAATAEISRTQIWQWARHGVRTDNGAVIDRHRVKACVASELAHLTKSVGKAGIGAGKFGEAAAIFVELSTNTKTFVDFLTLPAYERLTNDGK